jgi:DNA replication protein DnaC
MSCELCKDTPGFVMTTHEDGRETFEQCDCVLRAYQKDKRSRANIPTEYQAASFDNFMFPDNNPPVRSQYTAAVFAARAYVRNFPNCEPRGLLFIGDVGAGKTHLAAAVLRGLLERGFEGVFYNYSRLLDHITMSWKPAEAGPMDKEAYRRAIETPVLVLDDLGAHRIKDWVEDKVTEIVTERCDNRLATIFTTNLPDTYIGDGGKPLDDHGAWKQSIEQYKYKRTLEEHVGPRVRSRLFQMCKVIRMDGPDYRQIIASRVR